MILISQLPWIKRALRLIFTAEHFIFKRAIKGLPVQIFEQHAILGLKKDATKSAIKCLKIKKGY